MKQPLKQVRIGPALYPRIVDIAHKNGLNVQAQVNIWLAEAIERAEAKERQREAQKVRGAA